MKVKVPHIASLHFALYLVYFWYFAFFGVCAKANMRCQILRTTSSFNFFFVFAAHGWDANISLNRNWTQRNPLAQVKKCLFVNRRSLCSKWVSISCTVIQQVNSGTAHFKVFRWFFGAANPLEIAANIFRLDLLFFCRWLLLITVFQCCRTAYGISVSEQNKCVN